MNHTAFIINNREKSALLKNCLLEAEELSLNHCPKQLDKFTISPKKFFIQLI
jgi:hypothetical protein